MASSLEPYSPARAGPDIAKLIMMVERANAARTMMSSSPCGEAQARQTNSHTLAVLRLVRPAWPAALRVCRGRGPQDATIRHISRAGAEVLDNRPDSARRCLPSHDCHIRPCGRTGIVIGLLGEF